MGDGMEKPVEPSTMMNMGEDNRYEALPGILKIIFLFLTVIGILMSIFYLFSIRVAGHVLMEVTYYYLFIGIYGACCFLILPSMKKLKRVPWYDYLAAVLTLGIAIYFALHEYEISQLGWSQLLKRWIWNCGVISPWSRQNLSCR